MTERNDGPPVFFNHETGPALTFFPSVEDRRPVMNAHVRLENERVVVDRVVVLDVADVRQLHRYLQQWLTANITTEEALRALDESLESLKALRASEGAVKGRTLACCAEGHHTFSWREGYAACRFCGKPPVSKPGGAG